MEEQNSNQPALESIAMLSKARDECFRQMGNLDIPKETRNEFSSKHQKLSEIIDNLTAQLLHDGSTKLTNSKDLQATNAKLTKHIGELNGVGKSLDTAQKLFNSLDQVIQLGTALMTLV